MSQERLSMRKISRRVLIMVSLFLMIIDTDAQIISVDMNISNEKLDPVPTSVRLILSGKDSTYRQTFGIWLWGCTVNLPRLPTALS